MSFFVFIFLICLSLVSTAQVGSKGKPVYLDIDTLKGQDTLYISLPTLTGYYSLSWELYFEQIGGTSDGVGVLQASNDTIYNTINTVEGAITTIPNDTIDIENGLLQTYWLYGTPGNNYRVKLIGTLGDTTRVISNYIRK